MFTLISQDNERRCVGVIATQPEHSYWTTTPYLGGLIKEFHDVENDTWIESATAEEILEHQKEIYNELDVKYTKRISELVEKHVQKNIIDGTPIPKEVLEERERLKQDFYSLTNKDLKK